MGGERSRVSKCLAKERIPILNKQHIFKRKLDAKLKPEKPKRCKPTSLQELRRESIDELFHANDGIDKQENKFGGGPSTSRLGPFRSDDTLLDFAEFIKAPVIEGSLSSSVEPDCSTIKNEITGESKNTSHKTLDNYPPPRNNGRQGKIPTKPKNSEQPNAAAGSQEPDQVAHNSKQTSKISSEMNNLEKTMQFSKKEASLRMDVRREAKRFSDKCIESEKRRTEVITKMSSIKEEIPEPEPEFVVKICSETRRMASLCEELAQCRRLLQKNERNNQNMDFADKHRRIISEGLALIKKQEENNHSRYPELQFVFDQVNSR